MQRRKQIDYQAKQGNHEDYDYEFAYELGAEIMKENMQRKDNYLKNFWQQKPRRLILHLKLGFLVSQQNQ